MAGLINAEDVAAVKDRASLVDVVREHVTLRPAGPGAMKGLCPFHDEKTPSFTIRETIGTYHCFGCGEGGDVLDFIQKIEHLSFSEAVEFLAGRLGIAIRREETPGAPKGPTSSQRTRMIEAHRVAEQFYTEYLISSPNARAGRDFLRQRDFNREAVSQFGVGFSPREGSELTSHLLSRGFTAAELIAAGLSGQSARGLYDRFRGRLMWPIRTVAGETVGFGARRIFEDDKIAAKYLNTTETSIYKKSNLLYGLDLAKGDIASSRQVVVVEGYTDVMAAHLSGVTTAVATCGTAFGAEHIKLLRRILRDEAGGSPARVIFTFDGDDAGKKAAMKAYEQDQRWASESYVAVADDGMDPCDLRQARGGAAVKALVEHPVPMFEFAVRTTLAGFDLAQVDGRVAALHAVAPMLRGIRDSAQRSEYERAVAGWVGVEVDQVRSQTRRVRGPEVSQARRAPAHHDPVLIAERQLLQVALQYPTLLSSTHLETLSPTAFQAPAHLAIHDALIAAGPQGDRPLASWAADVRAAAADVVHPLMAELAVADLPTVFDQATGMPSVAYRDSLLARVVEVGLRRQISDATSTLRRLDSQVDDASRDQARAVSTQLQELQRQLAGLKAGH